MNRWPAPAEFRSLGVLAVPIIITQLAQMGMGVADAIMAGRVSATELAGIALGGNLYWPLMLLMSGIVMAVTPWVSQLHGAGRIGDTGAVVRQALWIAVCGGAMVAVLLQHVEPAYRLLGVDERAIPVAAGYLRAASLGLPAIAVAWGGRRFGIFIRGAESWRASCDWSAARRHDPAMSPTRAISSSPLAHSMIQSPVSARRSGSSIRASRPASRSAVPASNLRAACRRSRFRSAAMPCSMPRSMPSMRATFRT